MISSQPSHRSTSPPLPPPPSPNPQPPHFCGNFLWTLFVDTFCGHFLGTILRTLFVEFFLHLLWTLFVATSCEHLLWGLFVDTFCGHFLWTHFVYTFCGHFLCKINCSAKIMVNKKHNKKLNLFSSKKHLLWAARINWKFLCPEGVWFNMLFVRLFTLYWVSPCVVLTMTCTTNKRIIVIPWAVKAVTVGKAPPFPYSPLHKSGLDVYNDQNPHWNFSWILELSYQAESFCGWSLHPKTIKIISKHVWMFSTKIDTP